MLKGDGSSVVVLALRLLARRSVCVSRERRGRRAGLGGMGGGV